MILVAMRKLITETVYANVRMVCKNHNTYNENRKANTQNDTKHEYIVVMLGMMLIVMVMVMVVGMVIVLVIVTVVVGKGARWCGDARNPSGTVRVSRRPLT